MSASLCLLLCSFLGFPASITYMMARKVFIVTIIANIYLLHKMSKGKMIKAKRIGKSAAFILGIIILSAALSVVMYNITYELVKLLNF